MSADGMPVGTPRAERVAAAAARQAVRSAASGVTRADGEGELDAAIAEHRRPGMTAGQLAPLLPEHLQALYWRRKVGDYAQANGYDPDAD